MHRYDQKLQFAVPADRTPPKAQSRNQEMPGDGAAAFTLNIATTSTMDHYTVPYLTTCIHTRNGSSYHKAILQTVCHLLPSGSIFVFNCYSHHALIILTLKNDNCYNILQF